MVLSWRRLPQVETLPPQETAIKTSISWKEKHSSAVNALQDDMTRKVWKMEAKHQLLGVEMPA